MLRERLLLLRGCGSHPFAHGVRLVVEIVSHAQLIANAGLLVKHLLKPKTLDKISEMTARQKNLKALIAQWGGAGFSLPTILAFAVRFFLTPLKIAANELDVGWKSTTFLLTRRDSHVT